MGKLDAEQEKNQTSQWTDTHTYSANLYAHEADNKGISMFKVTTQFDKLEDFFLSASL